MRIKVDKELLPMRAHYFLFNAGTAPVVPFMPTLATQLGFSTVVIGMIYAVLPVVGMLAKSFFGFIADRYQKHRTLFLSAEILTAVSFFLIMFIPPIIPDAEFHSHGGVSSVRYCTPNAQELGNSLYGYFSNETLKCDLECQADDKFYDTVCNDWLHPSTDTNKTTPGDCPVDRQQDKFKFMVYLSMGHLLVEKNCIFFLTTHDLATINDQNVTMVSLKDKPLLKAPCKLDCHDEFFTDRLAEGSQIGNKEAFGLYQFWLFFLLLLLSWMGMAVVVSIGDAFCFATLGERHHLYGKQRLYGSIGFGIFGIIAGLLVDLMSRDSPTKDYTIAFWMTAVIIGFDVYASTKIKHTQTSLSRNILQDVGRLFLSINCVVFFVWCIVVGIFTSVIWSYLFVYLQDIRPENQEAMKTLQGLVMGVQCFSELPFFFLSGWILKKIGHVHTMSLVLFGFATRFTLYSMLEDPWYVLPIELFNGITFGLLYATMASYASIIAPPGTEATLQGLVGAIFEGIGVSVGNLVGGYLFAMISGRLTYEYFGIAGFIAFALHVSVQYFLKWLKRDSHENGKNIDSVKDGEEAQAQALNANTHKPNTIHNENTNTNANTNATATATATANKIDEFTDIDLN